MFLFRSAESLFYYVVGLLEALFYIAMGLTTWYVTRNVVFGEIMHSGGVGLHRLYWVKYCRQHFILNID